jgi:hypothetical protein
MKIKHFPTTNTDKVCEHYSKKDGVPVVYVCTTDFKKSDRPVDIFYRETPHPEFGNKYFGVGVNYEDGSYVIFNADPIEYFTFGCVEDDDGDLQYSRSHHDYKSFDNGNMIDGGREYIRHGGKVDVYIVKDGEMVKENIKPNLELDLLRNENVIKKCKHSVIYSQNLYAALCNNRFFYGNQQWTCSWRMSGGIVADMRDCGEDYMDWYCSGMADKEGYVSESVVTDEIRLDLLKLGWVVKPYEQRLEPGIYRNVW